jgi:hypothetical protein
MPAQNAPYEVLALAILALVVIVICVVLKFAVDAKGDCEEDRHNGLDGRAGLEPREARGFEVKLTPGMTPELIEKKEDDDGLG